MADVTSLQSALSATAETAARRSAATGHKTATESSSRKIADVVDLSQTARAAAAFRAARDLTGQQLADRLDDDLKANKAATDAFAARLANGRSTGAGTTGDAAHDAVVDIMREGKPANFWDRLVARLFNR